MSKSHEGGDDLTCRTHREPGGNRVEVANAGARLILAPDWKPIVWTEEERRKGQAWGLKTIELFHTHGTPPVEG
jgi:catechol 2,3-dioxygenase